PAGAVCRAADAAGCRGGAGAGVLPRHHRLHPDVPPPRARRRRDGDRACRAGAGRRAHCRGETVMEAFLSVLASALLLLGALLGLIGAIGVIRLPDSYTRMHSASK